MTTSVVYPYAKLGKDRIHELEGIQYINHGCGIVQFKGVINIPTNDVLPYIDDNVEVPSCGMRIEKDESGAVKAYQYDGTEIPYENLLRMPLRFFNPHGHGGGPVTPSTPPHLVDFFCEAEDVAYKCLLRYTDLHPFIVGTLQWRARGHVLKYVKGASLGLHNDNDTNTMIINGQRYFSQRDIAVHQTVNAILYLNDDYEGGVFRFPVADVTLKADKGDIVFFPANYVGTHAVSPVTEGERYVYLIEYGNGGHQITEIAEPTDGGEWGLLTWMPFVRQDYEALVTAGLSHYDDHKDIELGLHGSTPVKQNRTPEGPPEGTFISYDLEPRIGGALP